MGRQALSTRVPAGRDKHALRVRLHLSHHLCSHTLASPVGASWRLRCSTQSVQVRGRGAVSTLHPSARRPRQDEHAPYVRLRLRHRRAAVRWNDHSARHGGSSAEQNAGVYGCLRFAQLSSRKLASSDGASWRRLQCSTHCRCLRPRTRTQTSEQPRACFISRRVTAAPLQHTISADP